MSLRRVLNVAWVLLTDGMDAAAAEKFDRDIAGQRSQTPQRARESQQELMKAMGLPR